MKNLITAFRDYKLAEKMGIKQAKIVYLQNTGWVCFWFFNKRTIKKLPNAEIVC